MRYERYATPRDWLVAAIETILTDRLMPTDAIIAPLAALVTHDDWID